MKKYTAILLGSFLLTILSGCGRSADTPPEAEDGTAQWKQEGFAVPGGLEEEQSLWAGEYLPWEHKNSGAASGDEFVRLDFGVCGELFWYLGIDREAQPNAGAEYTLEIYDTLSGESTVKRFSPEELGLEGEGALDSMDMVDGEHYVFRWADYTQDEDGMYRQTSGRMVYTDFASDSRIVDISGTDMQSIGNDMQGSGADMQSSGTDMQGSGTDMQSNGTDMQGGGTDMQSSGTDMQSSETDIQSQKTDMERDGFPEEPADGPVPQSLDWRCDGKGNICVTDYREDGSFGISLFHSDGGILLEHEGSVEQWLGEPLRTSEGELIFPVYDGAEKCYDFLWADTEKAELRSLVRAEAPYPDIARMYGMLGDDIYYRSRETETDWLVKWNVKSGRRVRIFDYQEAGINTNYEILLALREGQTPVLYLSKSKEGKSKEWLTVLMEQKPVFNDALRVADLAVSGESKAQVSACAVMASTESPAFHYEYEDVSAQEDRDRIMAELAQEKGPDLLFVPLEEMYLLEEKGLLLDIGELIPEELRRELLPGAVEIGTVNGRFVGVPAAVWADTLAVAEEIWPEDTWKLEDVIGLMEEGKLEGTIRNLPFMMNGGYMEPTLTVSMLVKYSLADSFLIDWENGQCYFDDERFIRLLEITGTDRSGVPADVDVWMNGGKDILWGCFRTEANFLDFFAHMESENGRITGYPTEGACGSYLAVDGGVLAVNAKTVQKEAAAWFLETLLGEELQAKKHAWCMSVRKLAPEDYIAEESGRLVFMGGEHAPEVPVFEDGTTALHRAKAFLESCTAAPRGYSQISRILAEELGAMHAEGKSPKDTAEIINSRVQLYLDEGNWKP